jgi:hypothetical protein
MRFWAAACTNSDAPHLRGRFPGPATGVVVVMAPGRAGLPGFFIFSCVVFTTVGVNARLLCNGLRKLSHPLFEYFTPRKIDEEEARPSRPTSCNSHAGFFLQCCFFQRGNPHHPSTGNLEGSKTTELLFMAWYIHCFPLILLTSVGLKYENDTHTTDMKADSEPWVIL